MTEKNTKYYLIKEVAQWTGLSEQVIRKWEERYGVIEPKRLENGYRVYTTEDLLTLKELKNHRDEGKSMKRAVQLLASRDPIIESYPQQSPVEISPYVKDLIHSGTAYNEETLIFILKKANHEYGLDLFLQNTVQPFLHEIGSLWETGEWDESQETLSSMVVKDFLTGISRNFNNSADAPHALGFCLPYERHEIPLQLMLLRMKMQGWRTTMIGASPKYSSIETLVKQFQPQKVLLSATTTLPFQKDEDLLNNLDTIAMKYKDIAFYIGGRGVWEYTRILKPEHLQVCTTIEDVIIEK